MNEHLARKHPDQTTLSSKIDVDALPDAEDAPNFSSTTDDLLNKLSKLNNFDNLTNQNGSSPLDLSFNGNLNEYVICLYI